MTVRGDEPTNLAQLAAKNKTPLSRAVLEYVESLLNISPKSFHVLQLFNKVSDTFTEIVPRSSIELASTPGETKKSETTT